MDVRNQRLKTKDFCPFVEKWDFRKEIEKF